MRDYVLRFAFTGLPVRGVLADLSCCWQQLAALRSYDAAVSKWLAQAMLAVTMMRSGIKDRGMLGLQIRSASGLRLLTADCNQLLQVRAAASCAETEPLPTSLQQLDDGVLALMLHDREQILSRGLVGLSPVDGKHYSDHDEHDDSGMNSALEHYFDQSEQLQTRFLLFFHQQRPTGIMLQRMPGPMADDDWHRLGLMLDSLHAEETHITQAETLLGKLFAEDEVVVFEPQHPVYHCSCDRERVAAVLLQLGEDDINEVLQEQNEVRVDCEHCGRVYRFDSVDVGQLFAAGEVLAPSSDALQ